MKNDQNYVFKTASGELRQKAVQLHVERYVEVGFFNEGEHDPYQAGAVYFTAQPAHAQSVVGVTRLIFDKMDKLPTLQNFNIYDIERARLMQLDAIRYAELSAFTKLPAHDVSVGLLKTALQYSLDIGLTHWVCCVDERVYQYMNRIFKFPFRTIGEPRVYLGSNTIPCVLILEDALTNIKQERLPLYQYLMDREPQYREVMQ